MAISPEEPPEERYSTLTEVKQRLDSLAIQSLQPEKLPGFKIAVHGLLTEDGVIRRKKLNLELEKWTAGLGLFMIDKLQQPTRIELRAIRLMRIQSIMINIYNAVTLTSFEVEFDKHIAGFRVMVALAKQIIDAQEDDLPLLMAATPVVSEDLKQPIASLLPTQCFLDHLNLTLMLFFTACKCRNPVIRREALSLLARIQPVMEGIWYAPMQAKIAQYMMEIEEKSCSWKVTEDPATWPRERQRMHASYIVPLRSTLMTFAVNLLWRPGGDGAEYETICADLSFM